MPGNSGCRPPDEAAPLRGDPRKMEAAIGADGRRGLGSARHRDGHYRSRAKSATCQARGAWQPPTRGDTDTSHCKL